MHGMSRFVRNMLFPNTNKMCECLTDPGQSESQIQTSWVLVLLDKARAGYQMKYAINLWFV
jgi:hypothetical protein